MKSLTDTHISEHQFAQIRIILHGCVDVNNVGTIVEWRSAAGNCPLNVVNRAVALQNIVFSDEDDVAVRELVVILAGIRDVGIKHTAVVSGGGFMFFGQYFIKMWAGEEYDNAY